MSGFLLDTNCISELVRGKPEPRVLEWIEATDESLLYLSVLTLGEIRKGVAGLPHSKRRTHLEAWLELELQARFLGGFCPSMRESPTGGACSPLKPGARKEPCRPSTACWPPPPFTTILRSSPATSAILLARRC